MEQTVNKQGYEIIIVDDGSSDKTPNLGRSFVESGNGRIKYLCQENKGPAAARNLGIQHAKGDIVAFLDDDCRADKSWLEELVKGYEDPLIGGTGGRILSPLRETLADRYCAHVGLLETPKMRKNEVEYVITANASFRKSVLGEVGGFDEHFAFPGGEDPDLSDRILKVGYRLLYNSKAVVNHYHPRSLRTLGRTYFNYGTGKGISLLKDKKGIPAVIYHVLSIALAFLLALKNIPSYILVTRGWQGLTFAFFDVYIRAVYRVGLVIGYVRYRRLLSQERVKKDSSPL